MSGGKYSGLDALLNLLICSFIGSQVLLKNETGKVAYGFQHHVPFRWVAALPKVKWSVMIVRLSYRSCMHN